jgi:O-antigen biosynthesis protein
MISFIIPLYNCLSHTKECLRTLQVSLPHGLVYEIVFVDDGSTDGTREWLQEQSGVIRSVLNEQNLGYAAANNRGAGLAKGDLLVLLNNDLLFSPGWLEPMLALQRKLPSPGCIGNVQYNVASGALDHTGITFDQKGKPAHDTTFPLLAALISGYRTAAAVTGACLMISAATWAKLGGFDEGYRNGGEDVDLCLKSQTAGLTNAVALRSQIRHHVSASPGRKLHDEANSRRLTIRWRDQIARLSTRAWSQSFLESQWGRSHNPTDIANGIAVLMYHLQLKSDVPNVVLNGVNSAIADEIIRWEQLLAD